MKRIEAIKKLMTGADDVMIRLKDGTGYYCRELVKLYAYLDAELCDPKEDPQKPKDEAEKKDCNFTATLQQDQSIDNKPVKKVVAGSQKREKIDTGKLIALAKAGRTREWIADEMGVSVATVYNYLKKAKEEGRL